MNDSLTAGWILYCLTFCTEFSCNAMGINILHKDPSSGKYIIPAN